MITAIFTWEISPHPYKYKHGFVRPILAIGAPVLWKSQMIYKTTITLCTYVCVCMRKLNNDLKPLQYPRAKMTQQPLLKILLQRHKVQRLTQQSNLWRQEQKIMSWIRGTCILFCPKWVCEILQIKIWNIPIHFCLKYLFWHQFRTSVAMSAINCHLQFANEAWTHTKNEVKFYHYQFWELSRRFLPTHG